MTTLFKELSVGDQFLVGKYDDYVFTKIKDISYEKLKDDEVFIITGCNAVSERQIDFLTTFHMFEDRIVVEKIM